MKAEYIISIALTIGTFAAILLSVAMELVSDVSVFSQDLITILIAAMAIAAASFFAKGWLNNRKNDDSLQQLVNEAQPKNAVKEQQTNPESRILKTSERETEDSNLDPALYHLSAVLFYPSDTPRKDRVPSKSLPRRGIINWNTKKAYYMNKDADDFLIKRKINWTTRDWISEEDFAGFFEKQGFELIRRPANPSDLEKTTSQENKPEHDRGLSIRLGGFELITGKLTYKIGDTIRATVRVVSLTFGAVTIRLIGPSGQQPIIKDTEFHFYGTFNFDLAVVEQSWEKGVWRVIAQRGKMSAEQKIEIL